MRVHPKKAKIGIRSKKPNEIWQIDRTIIKLLNGSRVYLYAVIDQFSRKVLGWKVSATFEKMNTFDVLLQAVKFADTPVGDPSPKVLMEGEWKDYSR